MTYKKRIQVIYPDTNYPRLETIEGFKENEWIDIPINQDVEYKRGQLIKIVEDIIVIPPKDYEIHVVPRSSTFKNYNLMKVNHMGVIDNDYQGIDDKWYEYWYAFADGVIKKYSRLSQFRIVKQQNVEIIESGLRNIKKESRGGYGSTGK